jgi:inorganic pyrophosphatase
MTTYIAVNCIIEIERHSNQKWEYDRVNDKLVLDRVLKYPYFYPYAYGFIPNTIGNDGDELDIVLISDKKYENWNVSNQIIDAFIVGGLMMQDEKGRDDKIFVVPLDEIEHYEKKQKSDVSVIQENIKWFFSNYKSQDDDKWSKVYGILDKDAAEQVFKEARFDYEYKLEQKSG